MTIRCTAYAAENEIEISSELLDLISLHVSLIKAARSTSVKGSPLFSNFLHSTLDSLFGDILMNPHIIYFIQ